MVLELETEPEPEAEPETEAGPEVALLLLPDSLLDLTTTQGHTLRHLGFWQKRAFIGIQRAGLRSRYGDELDECYIYADAHEIQLWTWKRLIGEFREYLKEQELFTKINIISDNNWLENNYLHLHLFIKRNFSKF